MHTYIHTYIRTYVHTYEQPQLFTEEDSRLERAFFSLPHFTLSSKQDINGTSNVVRQEE